MYIMKLRKPVDFRKLAALLYNYIDRRNFAVRCCTSYIFGQWKNEIQFGTSANIPLMVRD